MYNLQKRFGQQTVATDDGSFTLYSPEFNECYHSVRDGALHESLAKHVIPALTLQKDKNKLTILDICFGLGYNTLATMYYIRKQNLSTKIYILSPEFDVALVRSLMSFDYPSEFDELRPVIEAISQKGHYEDKQFRIDVYLGDARKYLCHHKRYSMRDTQGIDIVYQDAFSPSKNPLLWTREWFADIRAACADDAVLTTYSIAAATRMGLYENGFELYEYSPEDTRKSLVASPSSITEVLPQMTRIDMKLKIERNPHAQSLRDRDFV